MADRVIDLLANPARARAMGACLRSRLLREHSLEAVVPLYREAYAMALADAAWRHAAYRFFLLKKRAARFSEPPPNPVPNRKRSTTTWLASHR